MFYEFNDYPYYTLISANSEEEAISCYGEQVCELEEEEDRDSAPDELTKEEVIAKIKNANFDSEYDREKTIKDLDIESDEPKVILIDGSLI